MYCLGCAYELRQLKGRVCPECGRGFDPEDRTTFARRPIPLAQDRRGKWLERAFVGLGLLPLLADVSVHVALVAARVSLGRWPHRGGMDDPWYLPGVRHFVEVTGWLVYATFFSMIPTSLVLLALALNRSWFRLGRGSALYLLLFGLGAGLFIWDPSEAWNWFFD